MRLLAIVAHPDDAGIFCGGTLAKHADRGDDVAIVHMTSGSFGGFTDEASVAETRRAEAADAAAALGADVAFLEFDDGRITYSLENRFAIVDVIREYRPAYILTHYRDDLHPDHRTTSRLVTDAYYMSSLPLLKTDAPAHDPENVYYFGKPTSDFEPTAVVDVADHVDAKEAAITAHESQLEFLEEHGGIDAEFDGLVDGVLAENRVLGKRTGATYAEGFEPLHEQTTAYLGGVN